jgi:hypothetical protein
MADRLDHVARHLHAQRQQLRRELCARQFHRPVVYQMKPDGTLEGLWTIADQGGVGTEVLTPMN